MVYGVNDLRKDYTPMLFPRVVPIEIARVKKNWDKAYYSRFAHVFNHPENPKFGETESEIHFNLRFVSAEPTPPYAYEIPNLPHCPVDSDCIVIAQDVGTEPSTGVRPDKNYKHWDEVVNLLRQKGHTNIVSVGVEGWGLKNTTDLTHLTLQETMALIKECPVFAGSDSGLYHIANVFHTPNVAVFCQNTNIVKNYDPKFYVNCTALEHPSPEEVANAMLEAYRPNLDRASYSPKK
jgi:ADP-heptose:LPS heptosyltransferase